MAGYGAALFAMPVGGEWFPQWMQNRKTVSISGVVRDVQPRPGSSLRAVLQHVAVTEPDGIQRKLDSGLVWTWKYPKVQLEPGQHVTFRSRLYPVRGYLNDHSWDYRTYWAQKGVFYRAYTKGAKGKVIAGPAPEAILWTLRQQLKHQVEAALETSPEQGRALLMALLFGDRSGIEADIYQAVRNGSLAHTLSLSGLHVGLVASLGWLIAWVAGYVYPRIYLRLPRPKLAVLCAIPLVLIYIWLGGARPSLIRAAVMFAAWGFLLLRDRQAALLDGLFLAAGLITLFSPLSLFDTGFQMSFVAVGGIGVLLPGILDLGRRMTPASWINTRKQTVFLFLTGLLGCSVAASIALAPVTLAVFGEVSLSLWMNLLWLPILGWLVMPLGFVGLALSLFHIGLFRLHLAALLLEYFAQSVVWLNTHGLLLTWAGPRPDFLFIFGYLLVVLGLALLVSFSIRIPWRYWIAGSALMLVPVVASQLPQEGLRLRVLDVGQGQSVLIDCPNGKRVIVDGGGVFSPTFDLGQSVIAPELGGRFFPGTDYLLLTHAQKDHSGGLVYPMRKYSVGVFASAPTSNPSNDLNEMLKAGKQRGIAHEVWTAGHVVDLGDGVELETVFPETGFTDNNANNESLVLRLTWNGRGLALLSGDIENPGIDLLLAKQFPLQADILIAPHHGSASSLHPEFYKAVSPKHVFISCGFLNYLRFPAKGVVQALHELGIPASSTANYGQLSAFWQTPDSQPVIKGFLEAPFLSQP